jgi:hypothetical protein
MADKRQRNRKAIQDLALEIVLDLYNRKREAIRKWKIPARGKRGSEQNMTRMIRSWKILAKVQGEWVNFWKDDPAWPEALRIYNLLRGR